MFYAVILSAYSSIESTRNCDLDRLFDHFGNRSFMITETQTIPQFLFAAAYGTVKDIRFQVLPSDRNTVNSYVLYKTKVNDNRSQKLKACIAPHGSKITWKTNSELIVRCVLHPEFGIKCLLLLDTAGGSKK